MSNDVKVNFKVIDQVTSEVKKINNSLNGFTDNITKTLKNFRGVGVVAGIAATSFWAVSKAITELTDKARENVLTNNKLSASIGYTSNDLKNQTIQLRETYKITTTQATAVQALVSNYFDNAEVIKMLTPAILNMSIATGKSTEQIAEQLSEAARGGDSLKKYGIILSDCRTESERFKKIVSSVNDKFGEQSKAIVNMKTPIENFKTQLDELETNLGRHLFKNGNYFFGLTELNNALKNSFKQIDISTSENLTKEQKARYVEILNIIGDFKNSLKTNTDDAVANVISEKINKLVLERDRLELLSKVSNETSKESEERNKAWYTKLELKRLEGQKKIDAGLEKLSIKNTKDKFDKEIIAAKASFKELEDLAKEYNVDTIKIQSALNIKLKNIEEERTKFIEEQNKKQLEEAKKISEERVKLITDEINKEKEYQSVIEDLYLTKTQLEDKAKKRDISDKYNKGIDAAYSSGNTFLGNILQNTRDQRLSDVDSARKEKSKYIVNVDENKYEQELNKFNEAYGTNTDTVKSRFEQERIAAQEHFNEMINLYGTTSEKQKQIELQRANALKLIDNEEKKVRKQNASDFLKNQLGTLQMLTEGNKKFSAINKTIAIASVTYDTVIAAMAAYKSAVKLGGVLGIVAGVAAAALVTANGMMQVSKIVNTKAYASGIRNTRDEFAQVHKDEIIHLPRGSEVINKRESTELIKEQQMVINMFFEDRTSETYKIMQKDIKSGKIDQLVREITKRQQKVTY